MAHDRKMYLSPFFGLAIAALTLAFPAFAEPANTPVRQLPDSGTVQVQGTVSSVNEEEKTFLLQDGSGSVSVESKRTPTVTKGDKVSVVGEMKRTDKGRHLEAETITKIVDVQSPSTPLP